MSFPTTIFRETGSVFTRVSATIKRAPQHITDTDVWGVSDPAERARGRGCELQAGSLTPLSVPTPRAGALNGRHKTPPDLDECDLANVRLDIQLPCAVGRKSSPLRHERR